MQYETCRHIKKKTESYRRLSFIKGERQYCYYHLMQRGRRLRRARALRNNSALPPRNPVARQVSTRCATPLPTSLRLWLPASSTLAPPASFSTPSSRSAPPTAASSRWKPPSWKSCKRRERGRPRFAIFWLTWVQTTTPASRNMLSSRRGILVSRPVPISMRETDAVLQKAKRGRRTTPERLRNPPHSSPRRAPRLSCLPYFPRGGLPDTASETARDAAPAP